MAHMFSTSRGQSAAVGASCAARSLAVDLPLSPQTLIGTFHTFFFFFSVSKSVRGFKPRLDWFLTNSHHHM